MTKIRCPYCAGRGGVTTHNGNGVFFCPICKGHGQINPEDAPVVQETMEDKFVKIFKRPHFHFKDRIGAYLKGGAFSLDIVAFDDYCHEHLGYTEEEHGSLFDFCVHLGGKEIGDFVRSLI